ncbi:MAG: histone deacetylase [Armatimonadetes bacterium]|nr:histone deacetylase [Armatimonadota bacterium]
MKTAFLTHPLFLEHDTGAGHPERPQRLTAIWNHLREVGLWDDLLHLPFEAASVADLERCHTRSHIERVKTIAQSGGGALDGDTIISPKSFDAAALASGAAMRGVDAVMSGEAHNAFVAARPCGHHAESGRRAHSPWGFCLFNHVAVAARHAQAKWDLERVAILDFDVHHGNGTQEIFYDDGSVFFASIHEAPLFPGSGAPSERGVGAGLGTTLNLPMGRRNPNVINRRLPDSALWRQRWRHIRKPLEGFAPQLILLSAGYDAHQDDPLAHIELRTEDFAYLVDDAKKWAQTLCNGKLVAVLEGGYDLKALSHSVAATLAVLRSDSPLPEPDNSREEIEEWLRQRPPSNRIGPAST